MYNLLLNNFVLSLTAIRSFWALAVYINKHDNNNNARNQNLTTISLSNMKDEIKRMHKKYQGLKKHLDRYSVTEISHRRNFLRKVLGDFAILKPSKEDEKDEKKKSEKCLMQKKKSFEDSDQINFTEKRIRKKVSFHVDKTSQMTKKFEKLIFMG